MLETYFASTGAVTPANAWEHVYRLLLWTDRTTGLAHCYESDKAQPGRPWYARSLAFHDWLSSALGVAPGELGQEIDWMFARGTEQLAALLTRREGSRAQLAAEQWASYEARGFPVPGEDAGLEALVKDELRDWLKGPPSAEVMRRLVQRIRAHMTHENKRKNLVGEGFEDVLAFIVPKLPGASAVTVPTRPMLHTLPGFRKPPGNEKPRKVDLALIGPKDRRILVSAKWSVRADREEQFGVDYEAYARLEDAGRDFAFVLITNEFDAARLSAACERRHAGRLLFTAVVHVNPQGPLAAYGPDAKRSAARLIEHVKSGRLTSLERWLESLTA